mgnify:CR=1 FL=1
MTKTHIHPVMLPESWTPHSVRSCTVAAPVSSHGGTCAVFRQLLLNRLTSQARDDRGHAAFLARQYLLCRWAHRALRDGCPQQWCEMQSCVSLPVSRLTCVTTCGWSVSLFLCEQISLPAQPLTFKDREPVLSVRTTRRVAREVSLNNASATTLLLTLLSLFQIVATSRLAVQFDAWLRLLLTGLRLSSPTKLRSATLHVLRSVVEADPSVMENKVCLSIVRASPPG